MHKTTTSGPNCLSRRFPPGVLNCLPSTGPIGGAALSRHKDVDKIAFTGSTATGRKILEAAAQSNLKKVTLELGGKSPHLIFASADLDKAAEQAVLGIMYNMGQDCCGGNEIGVQNATQLSNNATRYRLQDLCGSLNI